MTSYFGNSDYYHRDVSEIAEFFRHVWLQQFQCQPSTGFGHGLLDHLFRIELKLPGADDDELIATFIAAGRAISQRAYGPDVDLKIRHAGLAFIGRDPGHGDLQLRSVALVHPAMIDAFADAAEIASDGQPGLPINKADTDTGDPDSPWRWLCRGLRRQAKAPNSNRQFEN